MHKLENTKPNSNSLIFLENHPNFWSINTAAQSDSINILFLSQNFNFLVYFY
jgi:hypothetical protein